MLSRKIFSVAALSLCLTLGYFPSANAVGDNTTCTVTTGCDGSDCDGGDQEYGSLRNKISYGFNRDTHRFCTDLIKFEGSNENSPLVIKLTKALHVKNINDGECTLLHPLCEDGMSFFVDGSTHPGGVEIDTTGLSDDRCAIRVEADGQTWSGITINTNQPEIAAQALGDDLPNAVICDLGSDNDFSGVSRGSGGAGKCGDGIVQENLGEECDDGAENGPDKPCSAQCTLGPKDDDGDGVPDDQDNCSPSNPDHGCTGDECHNPKQNGTQPDCDGDGKGNKCDDDWDEDGVADGIDNCAPPHDVCDSSVLLTYGNADQKNTDEADEATTKYGDLCDDDLDGDGITNHDNGDGVPNEGEPDNPCTGGATTNCDDNCPEQPNADQKDEDEDGEGAICDTDDTPAVDDTDGDGVNDDTDNCVSVPNGPNEDNNKDTDGDGHGDACDSDKDDDGLPNEQDTGECLNELDADSDDDGLKDGNKDGNADPCPCDPDLECGASDPTDVDGDGILNEDDNCPSHKNGAGEDNQADSDGDDVGDACDPDNPDADTDGDGALNKDDNCPTLSNNDQVNQDGDSMGDICDPDPSVSDDQGGTVDEGGGCTLASGANPTMIPWLIFFTLGLIPLGRFRRALKK